MNLKKRFALTVADIGAALPMRMIAVHVPWDQFCAPGGPEAYAALVSGDAVPVIVSKSPEGAWARFTEAEGDWDAICRLTPVEDQPWRTMPVESDHYPWELFGR